jgi:hypothetical protein
MPSGQILTNILQSSLLLSLTGKVQYQEGSF